MSDDPIPPISAESTTAIAAIATRASRKSWTRLEPSLLGAGGIATLAVLLQVLPSIGLVNPVYFPPLSSWLGSLGALAQTPAFWSALGSTLTGWIVGLAIATILGSVLGILIGSFRIVDRLLSSTIEFLRPIPSVALIPLVSLLFGISVQSTLVIVVYASLWPILIQVIYGVRDVDRVALDTASSYRLGRTRTIARVIWPSIMPYLIVGIRLSAAVALILEVTGELVIGSPGIGKLIVLAQNSAAYSNMYALVLVAALLGVLINVATRLLEGRLLFWHASVQSEAV